MLTLGFSGGLSLAHEALADIPQSFTHDGAAVLIEDGRVVAAIEEERLNRIKHSNKLPARALQFCLASRGVRITDIDRIAYYATEEYCNALLARLRLLAPAMSGFPDARTMMRAALGREFGCDIDPRRIVFVPHHIAHAVSTFFLSGYDKSLILAIDGSGDHLSGLVALGSGTSITPVARFPQSKSLGIFYLTVISFLGYGTFDEYKVMGLAPYGDAASYRDILKTFYRLLPGGDYEIFFDKIPALFTRIEPRAKASPITQAHKNLAASLQEALEEIVLHVLSHYQRETGERSLCLAGGVAHNCTMNGKILYSGMCDRVFVQPAAHDAGCALGAALNAYYDAAERPARPARLEHVYLGTDIGEDAEIAAELSAWDRFITFERMPDKARQVAALLAGGSVLGWVQGRSEFGPRALGNRSILADPRPAENKDLINQMVKKREAYRPFAPSALVEDARDYFELPEGGDGFSFMIFVVRVREDKRAVLGATTHVDGTARLQTVSRETNPMFWELIKAFKDLTGVPVLLNTSFNNDVEPIVDSVEDAVVSFLTTNLHGLVVGDYLVKKREPSLEDKLSLRVGLPAHVKLEEIKRYTASARVTIASEIRTTFDARFKLGVSSDTSAVLMEVDGDKTLGELLSAVPAAAERTADIVDEIAELWSRRVVTLRPLP